MVTGCEYPGAKREKELGVTVDILIKVPTQCNATAKKANRVFRIIRKGIEMIMVDIIMPLNRFIMRAHLKCCVEFWSLLSLKEHYRAGKKCSTFSMR